MTLNSVYMQCDDESEAPPSRVMKVALFSGGHAAFSATYMPPVVYFAIGDFDEGTYEDSFTSSADRQFSVTLDDLIRTLVGLGAIEGATIAPGITLDAA